MREASRTQYAKKIVFLIPLTTCNLSIASKRIFEIRPFSNPQFSGGNTGKLRVFFMHTNAALGVQNRVQFTWAKQVGHHSLMQVDDVLVYDDDKDEAFLGHL